MSMSYTSSMDFFYDIRDTVNSGTPVNMHVYVESDFDGNVMRHEGFLCTLREEKDIKTMARRANDIVADSWSGYLVFRNKNSGKGLILDSNRDNTDREVLFTIMD